MTVNEAINYLEDAKIEFKIPKAAVTARKTNEALDMAIKVLEQQPCEDTISRQEAIDATWFEPLSSAQPEIIRCKECKYWKDSDGVYRRGFDAESKCPLNLKKVYEGTFYCGMAERRTDG